MKVVGYHKSLPITDADSLLDAELPQPTPGPHDLRVLIKAVSVNPVDVKIRHRATPPAGELKILGFDAAGVVDAVGEAVTLFHPGDEVFYAGTNMRPGTNSEFHLVDERLVGKKPKSLSFAGAAALPLTTITAWELLFERLGVPPSKTPGQDAILIVGAGGGVGSILIQLARKLTGLTVIATASRPETVAWCLDLGAHHVIDHSQPFAEQLGRIGHESVTYVAGLNATEQHYESIVEALAPQGKFGLIDDPKSLDATALKRKCLSLHWEFMFARSIYQTPDMIAQHRLLNEVSSLLDTGILRTTLVDAFGTICAENMKKAHAQIESGKSRGKIVLEGF